MIEVVIEFIFEVIIEILGQLMLEIGTEFGIVSIKQTFKSVKDPNLLLSIVGLLILGSIFGFISVFIFPEKIISEHKISGISIIVLPIFTGLILKLFGNWRRKKGKYASYLATFWGGFSFSFALTAVRWFFVNS
jgi:hypothetical protein